MKMHGFQELSGGKGHAHSDLSFSQRDGSSDFNSFVKGSAYADLASHSQVPRTWGGRNTAVLTSVSTWRNAEQAKGGRKVYVPRRLECAWSQQSRLHLFPLLSDVQSALDAAQDGLGFPDSRRITGWNSVLLALRKRAHDSWHFPQKAGCGTPGLHKHFLSRSCWNQERPSPWES